MLFLRLYPGFVQWSLLSPGEFAPRGVSLVSGCLETPLLHRVHTALATGSADCPRDVRTKASSGFSLLLVWRVNPRVSIPGFSTDDAPLSMVPLPRGGSQGFLMHLGLFPVSKLLLWRLVVPSCHSRTQSGVTSRAGSAEATAGYVQASFVVLGTCLSNIPLGYFVSILGRNLQFSHSLQGACSPGARLSC